uniref:Uncharacterized protein n=1 Tax=Anguilla anguilla TaxID=7936 RepID=A0A0E9RR37_ANGAN
MRLLVIGSPLALLPNCYWPLYGFLYGILLFEKKLNI